MKQLVLLSLIAASLFGGIAERLILHEAQEAQRAGDCSRAMTLYRKLPAEDDRLRYNLANCLYRLGLYREALTLYRSLEAPELNARRYHNMGNTLVRLGRLAEAAAAYRAALKFTNDDATRANLRLIQALLSLEGATRTQKRLQCKSTPLRPGSGRSPDDYFDTKRKGDKLVEAKTGTIRRLDNRARSVVSQGADAEARRLTGRRTAAQARAASGAKVSERYWQNRLERRPIKALLIPISSTGASHDTDPW